MSLLIECACGKKLNVRAELAGKKVKCPGCGNVVIAPAPLPDEPQIQLEVVEETAVQTPTPPPVWTEKKKKPAPPNIEDEDEEKDKADDDEDDADAEDFTHWLFPGTFSTEIMVLSREGIWFDNIKGDGIKKVPRQLKKGTHPSHVLGPKAICIEWGAIKSIYSNKKLRAFTIHFTAGEDTSKSLTPTDCEMRNEIFKTISRRLAPSWEMTTHKHTPITATFLPLGFIVLDIAVTIGLAILSTQIGGDWRGTGRGAGLAGLLNMLHWMGPLWTGVAGVFVAMLIAIWLLVRVMAPPIEMNIRPAPERAEEEGEGE
jgi:hypothetical protein